MKIIILGTGQIDGMLAGHLASEASDIIMVDIDDDRLRDLDDHLDIRTVQGKASFPTVLRQAGADDADMLVVVTNSGETNMVTCQVAYILFNTPTKIARVRKPTYLARTSLFDNEVISVDVLISPEQMVTNYIKCLIEHPDTLQMIDSAEGKVQLVGIKAYYGGPPVGQELHQLYKHMSNVDTRVAAIYRRNRPIIPQGGTVIEADDGVSLVAAKAHICTVMGEIRRLDDSYKWTIIASGGNIGKHLAEAIESCCQVEVVGRSLLCCWHLSDTLDSTIVLNGNASNRNLLLKENIGETDVFLALTNDDEANVMSSLLTKRLGINKVITLINNPACVDLMQGGEIGIATSPQLTTVGTLLARARRGDIKSVHPLHRGAVEAIEVVAHDDAKSSKVTSHSINEIKLPPGTTVDTLIRDGGVPIVHGDAHVKSGDYMLLFLIDKKYIRDVERLFQADLMFP